MPSEAYKGGSFQMQQNLIGLFFIKIKQKLFIPYKEAQLELHRNQFPSQQQGQQKGLGMEGTITGAKFLQIFDNLFHSARVQTMLDRLPKISLNVLEWSGQSLDQSQRRAQFTDLHHPICEGLQGGKKPRKQICWVKLDRQRADCNLCNFCY